MDAASLKIPDHPFRRAVPIEPTAWRRAIQRFAGKRPGRVIADEEGGILFMRYFLFRVPEHRMFGKWAGGQAYLHHYLRPDKDRFLHNHPWKNALAVQLAGGYLEFRQDGFDSITIDDRQVTIIRQTAKERRPGSFYLLSGSDFHTVAKLRNDTSWSFFMHGPYCRPWGFLEPTRSTFVKYRPVDADKSPSQKGNWWKTAPKGEMFHELFP